MFGFPWENKMEIDNTIKFMKEINTNYAWLAMVIPYPGTKMFNGNASKLQKLGKKTLWSEFIHINPIMAFLLNDGLTGNEKSELLSYVQKEFDEHNFTQFSIKSQMNIKKQQNGYLKNVQKDWATACI